MTITRRSKDLRLDTLEDSCNIRQLLNLRLSRVHPEATDNSCTHTVKALLTKPTLSYNPEAESDELILNLVLSSKPKPVRQTLESYITGEFPGWTLQSWWTTTDVVNEPF